MVLVWGAEGQSLGWRRDRGLTCQVKGCGNLCSESGQEISSGEEAQHCPAVHGTLCAGVCHHLCPAPASLTACLFTAPLPSPSPLRNSSHNVGASRPGSPLLFPRNPFLRISFNLCTWASSKAPQFYFGLFLFSYKKNLEPGCPGALAPP